LQYWYLERYSSAGLVFNIVESKGWIGWWKETERRGISVVVWIYFATFFTVPLPVCLKTEGKVETPIPV